MPRETLVFGQGVDRATGATVVDPASPQDLFNMYAREMKLALRPGFAGTPFAAIDWGTDILAIAPLKATKDILFVVLDRATREVRIYRVNPIPTEALETESGDLILTEDGLPLYVGSAGAQLAGTWGTLDPDALFPVVLFAESDSKLFFAHDEPTLAFRLPTVYYTPDPVDSAIGTLTTLQADLNGDGVAEDVYFRGVEPFYSHLVGWGYGSESAGEQNRGEIVRLSTPGNPTEFKSAAYFIAGARSDPVTRCIVTRGNLGVCKRAESYIILGDSPANYVIQLADPDYGCIAARLATTIGDDAMVWSESGPRILTTGRSINVGLSLELDGPAPDALSSLGADRTGFSIFDPDRITAEFLFPVVDWETATTAPTAGFLVSLRNPQEARWSYVEREQSLYCASKVLDNKAEPPVVAGYASAVSATDDGIDADPRYRTALLEWTNNGAFGDEVVQIFARPAGGAWSIISTVGVGSSPQSTILTALPTLTEYDFALRFFRDGSVAAGFTGSDPDAWTAPTAALGRADGVETGCETPSVPSGIWSRTSPTEMKVALAWSNTQTFVPQRVEIADNPAGPWSPLTSFDGTADVTTSDELFDNSFIEVTRYFRIQPVRGTILGTPGPEVEVEFGNGLIPTLGAPSASEVQAIACGVPWIVDVSTPVIDPNPTDYRLAILDYDSLAVLDADWPQDGTPYTDNTGHVGDPSFTGFPYTRRYRLQLRLRSDGSLIDQADSNRLDIETGPPC